MAATTHKQRQVGVQLARTNRGYMQSSKFEIEKRKKDFYENQEKINIIAGHSGCG
ncbi:hypothetical protein FACS1894198_1360 [Clostridia bacterium]|nr:hypothetical protein FACS1894198_1360 [Clostridia bacterium]